MPEPDVRREHWRAGAAVRLGTASLLPVERTVTCVRDVPHGAWIATVHEPCALVVRDALGLRVLDAGGGAHSLQDLRERVPGIEPLLASL